MSPKILYLILFLIADVFSAFGQNNICGEYHNHFSSRLILNLDSTYNYTWRFDLAYSWSNGKWVLKNDTLYLKCIPIYDTANYNDSIGNFKPSYGDSLILSIDDKSERISSGTAILTFISSGGQNRSPNPNKLFFRRNKLYEIKSNGHLDRKRIKGFWTRRKHATYYIKE
jgi:hypothetical protein